MISAKSLSGDIISIEASDTIEFERKYKELYVKPKFRPFVSVNLMETAVFFYEDEKEEEKVTSEWTFIVNIHNYAICLDGYRDSWASLLLNEDPRIIEMFESLDNKDKTSYLWRSLSKNPVAISLLRQYPQNIYWPYALKHNKNVGELLDLYKPQRKYLLWNEMIKHSKNAFDIISTKKYESDANNWYDFLSNKHINPEWVQYIIDTSPTVYGEYLDSEGDAHGDYSYTFKIRKHHWRDISKMPIMLPLLKRYITNICWKELSSNPCREAIELLEQYPERVVMSSLCSNETPEAMDFLLKINPDLKINNKGWLALCRNPFATYIVLSSSRHIKYRELAKNTNEDAIEDVKRHLSITTLSKEYKNDILKILITNKNAGEVVLDYVDRGYYDYENIHNILKMPYIFCPETYDF